MKKTRLHPVITGILKKRGYETREEIEEFLSPIPRKTYDPFDMKGMREAAELLISTVESGGKICIYGDYDADGVTSVSLLTEFLSGLTDNVEYYIPSRFSEGYGLNLSAVDEIHRRGADLIVTVDCGCVSYREVEHIKELGMKAIVTDHHNVDGRSPDCIMLNPKQKDDEYPFSYLCGCGVAFKLAQAVQRMLNLPENEINRLLDLVCVATIGDIVPLRDENRTLVKYGFDRIARGERPGLKMLIEEIGMNPVQLTSTNVAFGIVPHINAAGRMKEAVAGVRLLTGKEEEEITALVSELKTLNSKRKSLQEKIFRKAREELRTRTENDLFLIYDAGDGHEGVTGIVAGKLKEEFYRPVIIVTNTEENGIIKGTGRSVEGIDLHGIMSRCSNLYIKFGGHAGACGFTMKREHLAELRESLNGSVRDLLSVQPDLLCYQLKWDAEISSGDVSLSLAEQVAKLEPFGEGNLQPVFLITGILLRSVRRMGNSGQYLRLRCEGENGNLFDAVWFDVEEEAAGRLNPGCTVSLIASLDINVWRGRRSVQCVVKGVDFTADGRCGFSS